MSKERVVIKTPEGRVSFASVFEKSVFGDGKPAYELTLLFPKGTDMTALKALAAQAARDQWGEKLKDTVVAGKVTVQAIKPRSPVRDGDGIKQTGEPHPDEYKAHWFIKFRSYNRPGIVDRVGLEPITSEEGFYSGCWAKVTASPFAYGGPGTAYTPGVSFWLNNILKVRDDEPFSGRVAADADFAEDGEEAPTGDVSPRVQTGGETADDVFA